MKTHDRVHTQHRSDQPTGHWCTAGDYALTTSSSFRYTGHHLTYGLNLEILWESVCETTIQVINLLQMGMPHA